MPDLSKVMLNKVLENTLKTFMKYETMPMKRCGNCLYFIPQQSRLATPHSCSMIELTIRAVLEGQSVTSDFILEIDPRRGICEHHVSKTNVE